MTPTGPSTNPQPGAPSISELSRDLTGLENDYDRISRMALTTERNMPTTGSSTFNGGAAVLATRGSTEYNLIGDSQLTVNFATERMSGRASNFRGFTGNGRTFNAGGQLTYSGGQIGIGGDPRAFSLTYNGTLNAGGDQMALRGNATGLFSGNRSSGPIRTRAVQGISGTAGSITEQAGGTPNMTATVNGNPFVADFVFFGEN